VATHQGRTVLSAQWGTAVAKNPFLEFSFKGGKKGEKIAVTWEDNKGEKRTDEAIIG
jgi:sulfur-oxidizing protein SoxZ